MNDAAATLGVIAEAIFAALDGKYPEATPEGVAASVDRCWRNCENAEDAEDAGALEAMASPTRDLESDVANQARAFYLIARVWPKLAPMPKLIERLHGAVYGLDHSRTPLRSSNEVQDFPGALPTPVAEVPGALAALNASLLEVDRLVGAGRESQAGFMAEVFAAVIRVHPFEDGNGRTARMALQYCARRWHRPFLLVPKVRNNPQWKAALENAIVGDTSTMVGIFLEQWTEPDGARQ